VAFYLGLFLFRVNIFFARLNTAKITCVPHKRFVNSKNGVQTGFLSTKESQTDLATHRCIVQKFHMGRTPPRLRIPAFSSHLPPLLDLAT